MTFLYSSSLLRARKRRSEFTLCHDLSEPPYFSPALRRAAICRSNTVGSLMGILCLCTSQEGVIGFQVVRVFAHPVPVLLQRELQSEGRHDLLHDLVLQGKDLLQWPLVPLGPPGIGRRCIVQLPSDPHPLPRLAHTAL